MSVRPIIRPDGKPLDWNNPETWYCFDCGQEAETYKHLDGYVRCLDCSAKWEKQHLDIEEWR